MRLRGIRTIHTYNIYPILHYSPLIAVVVAVAAAYLILLAVVLVLVLLFIIDINDIISWKE